MTREELKGGFVNLTARKGYVIRRIGADPHSDIAGITVKITDVDNYEEVLKADVPAYTEAERKAKTVELIRERYDANKEFEVQRELLNALLDPQAMTLDETGEVSGEPEAVKAYREYNRYVEQCIARAPRAVIDEKRQRKETEARDV